MLHDSGVYALINGVTGKCYIGETSGSFEIRWLQHLSLLEAGKHRCHQLQADFNQYSGAAFSFQVLEVIPVELGKYHREGYWIAYCQETEECYNAPLGKNLAAGIAARRAEAEAKKAQKKVVEHRPKKEIP